MQAYDPTPGNPVAIAAMLEAFGMPHDNTWNAAMGASSMGSGGPAAAIQALLQQQAQAEQARQFNEKAKYMPFQYIVNPREDRATKERVAQYKGDLDAQRLLQAYQRNRADEDIRRQQLEQRMNMGMLKNSMQGQRLEQQRDVANMRNETLRDRMNQLRDQFMMNVAAQNERAANAERGKGERQEKNIQYKQGRDTLLEGGRNTRQDKELQYREGRDAEANKLKEKRLQQAADQFNNQMDWNREKLAKTEEGKDRRVQQVAQKSYRPYKLDWMAEDEQNAAGAANNERLQGTPLWKEVFEAVGKDTQKAQTALTQYFLKQMRIQGNK